MTRFVGGGGGGQEIPRLSYARRAPSRNLRCIDLVDSRNVMWCMQKHTHTKKNYQNWTRPARMVSGRLAICSQPSEPASGHSPVSRGGGGGLVENKAGGGGVLE